MYIKCIFIDWRMNVKGREIFLCVCKKNVYVYSEKTINFEKMKNGLTDQILYTLRSVHYHFRPHRLKIQFFPFQQR